MQIRCRRLRGHVHQHGGRHIGSSGRIAHARRHGQQRAGERLIHPGESERQCVEHTGWLLAAGIADLPKAHQVPFGGIVLPRAWIGRGEDVHHELPELAHARLLLECVVAACILQHQCHEQRLFVTGPQVAWGGAPGPILADPGQQVPEHVTLRSLQPGRIVRQPGAGGRGQNAPAGGQRAHIDGPPAVRVFLGRPVVIIP